MNEKNMSMVMVDNPVTDTIDFTIKIPKELFTKVYFDPMAQELMTKANSGLRPEEYVPFLSSLFNVFNIKEDKK